jgi:HK97 family phage prohead protease
MIYKQYESIIRAHGNDAARQMRFTISTGDRDRDGDILDPRGWDLSAFTQNPIVTWAHDYRALPIAKCTSIRSTAKGLEAVAEFPPVGLHEFADTVFEMLKGGFLNATSVGFQPLDSEPLGRTPCKRYTKQQLLEFSIVPVPSNPDALIHRSPPGRVWKKTLKDWASRRDDDQSPPPKKEDNIMPRYNNNEVVLRLIDEQPTKYGRHMKAGLQQIDFYNRLWARDEAERARKAQLMDEAKQAPRMPY